MPGKRATASSLSARPGWRRRPSCSRPSCGWPRSTSTRASIAQAQTAALALLNQPLADDVRAAALLLVAESAYWARNWDQAVTSYSRFVSDFPKRPEAPAAGFALGWAEFRRGRLDAARERWTAFAREAPADPRAGEALLLAAELAAKAGDRAQARAMLDRVAGQYPGTEQAEVARLNRAILSLNAGRVNDALAELNRVGPGSSTSSSPYLGRARVAKGLALIASKQPTAAESELKAALGQGDDAISQLGLGVIAFGRGQWDAAARGFGEARDSGCGRGCRRRRVRPGRGGLQSEEDRRLQEAGG